MSGDALAEENTAEYYRARERKEREAAEACVDPAIAKIHLDLAQRYDELAVKLETSDTRKQRFRLRPDRPVPDDAI